MGLEIIPFGRGDIDNQLQDDPERVEALPFGGILLSRAGKILHYNKTEGFHSGWVPSEVIGKVFFKDIASCAVGTRLYAAFLEYVETGTTNIVFDYAFDYNAQPANMRIHLRSTREGEACWMFIKRA